MAVSPARKMAAEILHRVEFSGALLSDVLYSPKFERLSPQDRGLATEIALGVLRRRGELDDRIADSSSRPVASLDPEVLTALRIGAYQIMHLDRVPARAAVNESVELVKAARKRSATGFVNAVLRRVGPPISSRDAARLSHPAWMVERWRRRYGDSTTEGLLDANLATPGVFLRVNAIFPEEETVAMLAGEGIATEPTEVRGCRRVLSGDPQESSCFREGRIRLQDIGSQAIVPLLELQPGQRFLDLCAAPGGKCFHAAEMAGSARGIVAADRQIERLRTMRRLATPPADRVLDMVALDAERPLPFRGLFDRILVDAPCTGTGTLARNPDIKWRISPDDIRRLAARQGEILDRALDLLAPPGVLLYSTCSLEPEENELVVNTILEKRTEFRAGAYLQRIPGREPGDGFFAQQILRK